MSHEPIESSRFAWLTRSALGLLLAVVIARCLMLEIARDSDAVGSSHSSGPSATTSLILNWIMLLPMLMILVRRLCDRDYTLRFLPAHIALILLASWTLASVAWSGDRFLALVGGMQIVAGASVFWSISQLIRRPDQLRVVVGGCVGLLLANVVQAMLYRWFELPDLQQFWAQNKLQILAERGWQPGDYMATRFEQKLMAGEMLGFNVSPNTLGALMVLFCIIAIASALQRLENRDDQGWVGLHFVIAAAALFPLLYTGSKASWGALLVGLVLLIAWRLLRTWLARNRTFVFSISVAALALGVVSLVAVGLNQGGLPDDSINFRWRYWVGSWHIFAESLLRGVGWTNFANAYLVHRLPVSAEEIQDPHNFLVRWATELGAIGAVLGIAWLGLWSWSVTRAAGTSAASITTIRVPTAMLIGVAAFAFSLFAVDWGLSNQPGGIATITLDVLKRVLLVGMVVMAIGVICLRDSEHADVDTRPAPWLIAGLFIAILTLLLQSSIDIAFFQTGPFLLAITIMGSLVGITAIDRPARKDAWTFSALIVCALTTIVLLVVYVIPVTLAESTAKYALRLTPNQPERALALYEKAFKQSPVSNADYLNKASLVAIAARVTTAERTRSLLDAAINANPRSSVYRLTRARWLATLGQQAMTEQALADFSEAVSMNPSDIDLRIEFADLLQRSGKLNEAATQLQEALRINDAYDPAEPERIELRMPAELERIRSTIARLQSQAAP